jgi:hypothetical protein
MTTMSSGGIASQARRYVFFPSHYCFVYIFTEYTLVYLPTYKWRRAQHIHQRLQPARYDNEANRGIAVSGERESDNYRGNGEHREGLRGHPSVCFLLTFIVFLLLYMVSA